MLKISTVVLLSLCLVAAIPSSTNLTTRMISKACEQAGDIATLPDYDTMGPDSRSYTMVLQCDHGHYKAKWVPWSPWSKP